MKKTVVEQLYYDFYGELLSDRQKTVLDYYYNDDCSIAEIAELTRMTRQGAYDACKRGRKQMEAYEKKLGLVGRFQKNRQLLSGIVDELAQAIARPQGLDPALKKELTDIKDKILVLSDEY